MLALRKSDFSWCGELHVADTQKLYHSVICFFASLYFGLPSQNFRSLDFAITRTGLLKHPPVLGATIYPNLGVSRPFSRALDTRASELRTKSIAPCPSRFVQFASQVGWPKALRKTRIPFLLHTMANSLVRDAVHLSTGGPIIRFLCHCWPRKVPILLPAKVDHRM